VIHSLESPREDIFPKLSEIDRDQAFIEYLDELDGPIPDDELVEWSDDINLFMEGLSNPDKLEELWENQKLRSYGMNLNLDCQADWMDTLQARISQMTPCRSKTT
jgi:hypothetical protein